MKIADLGGRAVLVTEAGAIDVAGASGGRFPTDPQALYDGWDDFRAWAIGVRAPAAAFDPTALLAPVPRPRQVFAIGTNYPLHAREARVADPRFPPTFTKFPTCLTGPDSTVELSGDRVDWEVELVVVIGRRAHRVAEVEGWGHVAGLTVGQDLSDRTVQLRPPTPQYSLGKSFPGFGPTGPWVVTPDELPRRDDLAIGCAVNGEEVQEGRTGDMIFSVAALVHHLSSVAVLLPGDLIFTGTPPGVGVARKPPRFLAPGDTLVSTIEAVGTIRTRLAAPA